MPRRLFDALEATFFTAGVCVSMRPFLVSELARRAGRLPATCWYAASSRDSVTLARVAGGECQRLRVLPAAAPSAAHIVSLVDRERLVAGARRAMP
jgi:hypothetical protein